MQLIPNAWFHCTNWMLLSMHRCMPSDLVMVSREPSRDVTPRDDSSWRHTGCVSARGWVMLDDVSAFGLWRQPLLLSTLWTHAWTLGVVHNLGKTPTNECTYLLELTLPLAPRVCSGVVPALLLEHDVSAKRRTQVQNNTCGGLQCTTAKTFEVLLMPSFKWK